MHFPHPVRDLSTVVHGDDFASLGTEPNLIWLTQQLQNRFLIKNRGILGPDKHDIKEIRLLNRIIAWESDHIRFEADQRHGEILCEMFGVAGSKGAITPGSNDFKSEPEDESLDEKLDSASATAYRAGAARCNFLGLDRPDVQYAAKEVSRGMASPTIGDVIKLKRLAK